MSRSQHAPILGDDPGARMLASLPESLAEGRVVRALFASLGDELGVVSEGIDVLMRARWPTVCDPHALDRLASMLLMRRSAGEGEGEFRRRIRSTTESLTSGSGDVDTVRRIVSASLGEGAIVEENPARVRGAAAAGLQFGEALKVFNAGLDDAPLSVSVVARHSALDLRISVAGGGDAVRMRGTLAEGDHFFFDLDGKAWLNGRACDDRVERTGRLALSRGACGVLVTEARGRFDHSRFDESVIASPTQGVADVEVRWRERAAATVRVSMPGPVFHGGAASGVQAEVTRVLSQVRSAGVSLLIDLREEFAEAGAGGRELVPVVAGGFTATEEQRMSGRFEASASLGFEERATAGGDESPPVPSGKFGHGKFDSEDSRFV